jgi:hypothetical protein
MLLPLAHDVDSCLCVQPPVPLLLLLVQVVGGRTRVLLVLHLPQTLPAL